ncbi:MAG: DUF305 domain-containing protein [Longimicrobiales bacterium]
MRASRTRWIIVALLAPFAAACSQATTTTSPTPAPQSPAPQDPAPRTGAASGELSAAEIEAIYDARMDSVRMHFSPADVAFMSGMIHHHAQAIEMALMVPTHEANAQVQTLAARILNAQRDEIARMQQWLRDRDQTVPEVHVTGTDVMVHGADHVMHMPGMLTPDQMRELSAARGSAFDRLFLTFMIQHHRGAVTMVHELFATDGAAQDDTVFKLASDVQVDQSTEVDRMERMLSAMPQSE